MPPDVLKRPMPTVPVSAMHLYCAVRSLAAQPVSPVIAHRHLVPDVLLDFYMWHGVHLDSGLADELAQHLALGGELDEGELDGLVVGEGRAEGGARVGIGDGFLDAVDGCAEGGGGLPDAVFVDEGLRDAEAIVNGTEDGGGGNPDGIYGDGGVVGGHVEGPACVLEDLHARNQENCSRWGWVTYHS